MIKRMMVAVLALSAVGAVSLVQPTAASASVSATAGGGHRPIACLPQGAKCTWSSDCCSGSCAGPTPPVCQ